MSADAAVYCILCGVRLEPIHRFCWSCGAERWSPDASGTAAEAAEPEAEAAEPAEPAAEAERPPPVPGTPVFVAAPPAASKGPAVSLGLLPWLYAAGAVLFLVEATQQLALALSSDWRGEFLARLGQQGIRAPMQQQVLTVDLVILIGGSVCAAVLHGVAFYGLRRRRRWGWIAALVVASLWSLLIVGIPVVIRLVNRNVRQAFGVD